MKIRFGLHLDGQRGWQARNALGDTVVGPLGMLNILETHLGLLADQPGHAERIAQYRDCMQQCDTTERFYHQSFVLDELGTAATLLAWRDQWHLHGWSGAGQPLSRRLQDMVAVEQKARQHLAPGMGERLAAVAAALEDHRVPIREVVLKDALERFPERWQVVLHKLPIQVAAPPIATPAPGFLGQLQARLLAVLQQQPTGEPLAWQPDGSVTLVRADNGFLAGRWLAARMQADGADTLFVAQVEGELLDGLLVAAGLPRQGLRDPSASRPALQVLPLALELIWEPLDLFRLLEFLTHPLCPVRGFARRLLAEKVAQYPGIQGAKWDQALAAIAEHYGGSQNRDAKAVLAQVAFWVAHTRHDPTAGAPIEGVIKRVEALGNQFRRRLADEDAVSRAAFGSGLAQCRATADALEALRAQGVQALRPRQLQQLVAQATAQGSENPLLQAEVGAMRLVTHPGAVIEPSKQVVWWQMVRPALPGSYPWSRAEIAELAKDGARLPDVSSVLDQAASDWLRPILAARQHLLLVLPPKGEEVHPVWQMIESLVDSLPVVTLEDRLTRPEQGMVAVTHQPLPARKRFWKLPPTTPLPKLDRESFSSLERLLFNPYQWLLEYAARLSSSRSLALPGDFQLFGNLAHGLVETLFKEKNPLGLAPGPFDTWFAGTFDRLVTEEGAILMQPGRRSDLEGFRIKLLRSVRELRRQLSAAKVTAVTPEMELTGSYQGGKLIGYADIVARKADGSTGIIDMKWAGMKKYPEKLRANRALQLAIYGYLLRQGKGAWPALAYFIMEAGKLLATGQDWFPKAQVVRNETGENTAQLWERFLVTRRWRKEQFQRGLYEVVLDGIPEEPDSTPPKKGLEIEFLSEDYNSCLVLAGWEE